MKTIPDLEGRQASTDEEPATSCSPERRASMTTGVLLTVAAWFVARVAVGAGWNPARDPFTFRPSLWVHWDSVNYLLIARHGTTLQHCHLAHQPWCGTAAWLPGYPWLLRAAHVTGLSLEDAGVVVSWLALATAIFLFWLGWGRDLPRARAFVVLLLFALFPGAVYNFSVFPTAVALACVVGALLAAVRHRFFVAAVAMIVAGLCYPSAWFAAGGLAVGLILGAWPLGGATVVRRALWGLAGLGSLLVLEYYDMLSTGHADAFFRMQAQVRVIESPFRAFASLVVRRNTIEQYFIGRFYGAVLAVQAVTAMVLAVAAPVVAVVRRRHRGWDESLLYPSLIGVAVVLGLLIEPSTGAWNRSIVLAAPCVVFLRRAPLPLLGAAVVGLGVLGAIMARPFFIGSLI
jgi:hypothetical protein